MPLFIISTPIGNLKDITIRAIETLKESDLILAEDTRRTSRLLQAYDISKNMESYNEHSQYRKNPLILEMLRLGKNIALVSDAGTPVICDTGKILVSECIKNDIKIVPIPGPNAAITALVASGLGDNFCFVGFMDKKEKKKIELFEEFKKSGRIYVFYESPYRLIKTLATMCNIIPDKKICVSREMTKKFEEFTNGTVQEVYEKLKDKTIKGEITIVLA